MDDRTPEQVAADKQADERRRIKVKFDEADEDGSGELDAEELAAFCESLGTKLSPDELEAALLILDESGDGQISCVPSQLYICMYMHMSVSLSCAPTPLTLSPPLLHVHYRYEEFAEWWLDD